MQFSDASDGVFVDVGAHIGSISRALSRQSPDVPVFAYEPMTENFDRLQQKCGEFPAIVPVKAAASDVEGELEVFLSSESVTHSLSPALNKDQYGRGSETIDRVTLDKEAERRAWTKIRILKVDAEGHDLNVLDGGAGLFQSGAVDVVVVECGFDDRFVSLPALMENLAGKGMLLHGIYDQSLHWSGQKVLEYFNALFLREDLTKA